MEGFGNMSQTKLGRELTKMGFDNWQKKIDKCGQESMCCNQECLWPLELWHFQ